MKPKLGACCQLAYHYALQVKPCVGRPGEVVGQNVQIRFEFDAKWRFVVTLNGFDHVALRLAHECFQYHRLTAIADQEAINNQCSLFGRRTL